MKIVQIVMSPGGTMYGLSSAGGVYFLESYNGKRRWETVVAPDNDPDSVCYHVDDGRLTGATVNYGGESVFLGRQP